jgi:hypothetical protein
VWQLQSANEKVGPGIGGRGIKEHDGGMNSTMIYCKNFGKCHNVPLSCTIIKKKTKERKRNGRSYSFKGKSHVPW